MAIKRDLTDKIKPFLKRKEFLAIIGPRQAGKTTLLDLLRESLINDFKVSEKNIRMITFENRRLLSQFDDDPVEFVKSYIPAAGTATFYLMIDEFQYSKEGGQKLKLIYDTIPNIKIFVTGSSSLDIKAQVGKFMVGRILSFHLYPFGFGEILRSRDARLEKIYNENNKKITNWLFKDKAPAVKSKIDTFAAEFIKHYEKYCVWGGYPAVTLARNDNERKKLLTDIYNGYILKDIKSLLELATDKNLYLLAQYLAAQAGNILVYQNLSQASGLPYRNLVKHINILKETFVCSEVKPFFKNRQKELSRNPKIFFVDMGFRDNIIENMNELNKHTDAGSIVENTVFIRLNELHEGFNKINFWRTKAGAEVDFVLHAAGEIIPIEVKYSNFEKEKIPRGLASFIESFKPKRAVVLTKNYWGRAKIADTEILFAPVYYI
ncbi:MAG: ATP-binding protein [Candidatus Omnitrophota bacterium]